MITDETGQCIDCEHYYLKPGYVYIARKPTIITTVLGSCISVCLYDTEQRYGGMNHYVLPCPGDGDEETSYYGTVAISELYNAFIGLNSVREFLVARITGGAYLSDSGLSQKIASANIDICRKYLFDLGIPIISEDIGGTSGRKLQFNTGINRLTTVLCTRQPEKNVRFRV